MKSFYHLVVKVDEFPAGPFVKSSIMALPRETLAAPGIAGPAGHENGHAGDSSRRSWAGHLEAQIALQNVGGYPTRIDDRHDRADGARVDDHVTPGSQIGGALHRVG